MISKWIGSFDAFIALIISYMGVSGTRWYKECRKSVPRLVPHDLRNSLAPPGFPVRLGYQEHFCSSPLGLECLQMVWKFGWSVGSLIYTQIKVWLQMLAANHFVTCVRCSPASSQSKMSLDAKEALQEFAKEVWSWPSGWAWCNRLAKALGGENCRGSQRAGSNWSETWGWRGNCRNGRCNWQLKAICVLKCVCESYCTSYFNTVARLFLSTFRRDTSLHAVRDSTAWFPALLIYSTNCKLHLTKRHSDSIMNTHRSRSEWINSKFC